MRTLHLTLGHLSLLVGVVGIFLPLLPTTPFLLLSSYCYSKGSERFHCWLNQHPRLGPPIRQWRQDGVIRLPIKIFATAFVAISISYPILFKEFSWGLKAFILATVGGALCFIWSRPSRPRPSSSSTDPEQAPLTSSAEDPKSAHRPAPIRARAKVGKLPEALKKS